MRILLLGANGFIGTAMQEVFTGDTRVSELTALGSADVNVTDERQVESAIAGTRPDAVVNLAALMPADRCETEPAEAYAVNALGPRWVSRACARAGAVPVYLSSDFVFDGLASAPYQPDARPRPLLTYGLTKLAGEHETRLGAERHLVVRTGCLFGPPPRSPRSHKCFLDRMLDQAASGGQLTVVDNVIVSATYTRDLAAMVLEMLHDETASGTYHAVGEGSVSYYDLCVAALAGMGLPQRVTRTSQLVFTTAPRPLYTPLVPALPEAARKHSRPWPDALADYLASRAV